jgi:hypothetical protein
MGKQTGCVLMVTDKANGNPRKLALFFFTPEGVSDPGSQTFAWVTTKIGTNR